MPWYAALYHRYGWTYITSFFLGENVARYTEGVGVETRRGPLFYLPVVFSDSFPWSLCLFGAAGMWIAERRRIRAKSLIQTARRLSPQRARPRADVAVGSRDRRRSLRSPRRSRISTFFPIVPAVAALGGLLIARSRRRRYA